MNLYDFLMLEKADFDTYDTVFDICVTVCEPYEYEEGDEKEYYDIFNELISITLYLLLSSVYLSPKSRLTISPLDIFSGTSLSVLISKYPATSDMIAGLLPPKASEFSSTIF